jgi:hypothetical protein
MGSMAIRLQGPPGCECYERRPPPRVVSDCRAKTRLPAANRIGSRRMSWQRRIYWAAALEPSRGSSILATPRQRSWRSSCQVSCWCSVRCHSGTASEAGPRRKRRCAGQRRRRRRARRCALQSGLDECRLWPYRLRDRSGRYTPALRPAPAVLVGRSPACSGRGGPSTGVR